MRQITKLEPLGLRARLILSFALGALLLSTVLSVITWNLTREDLLRQREDSAVTRVYANALTLRRTLTGTTDVAALLASLPTPDGAQLALLFEGTWDARNPVEFGQNDLPVSLRAEVSAGEVAKIRTRVGDTTYLIVGVPLPLEAVSTTRPSPSPTCNRPLTGCGTPCLAHRRSRRWRVGWSGSGPAGGCWFPCATLVWLPRRSPADSSTPVWPAAATTIWTRWWRRSTRWHRHSRSASNETPASPRRCRTSCDHR